MWVFALIGRQIVRMSQFLADSYLYMVTVCRFWTACSSFYVQVSITSCITTDYIRAEILYCLCMVRHCRRGRKRNLVSTWPHKTLLPFSTSIQPLRCRTCVRRPCSLQYPTTAMSASEPFTLAGPSSVLPGVARAAGTGSPAEPPRGACHLYMTLCLLMDILHNCACKCLIAMCQPTGASLITWAVQAHMSDPSMSTRYTRAAAARRCCCCSILHHADEISYCS